MPSRGDRCRVAFLLGDRAAYVTAAAVTADGTITANLVG